MKLTKEEVQHVAKLCRLGLTEKEIEKFQKELSGILDYVDMLNEVDADGVEPTAQVTGLTNVMEKDDIKRYENPEKLLRCSALPIEDNQIKVKPVFE